MFGLRIKYNAPLTLTYTLITVGLLIIDSVSGLGITARFFIVPGRTGFDPSNPIHFINILTYVLGHAGWTHLMGNLAFILLLGPILEEKYGTVSMLIMTVITAAATGIFNILFFPNPLLGGSGIVFMMIILSSFTNIKKQGTSAYFHPYYDHLSDHRDFHGF